MTSLFFRSFIRSRGDKAGRKPYRTRCILLRQHCQFKRIRHHRQLSRRLAGHFPPPASTDVRIQAFNRLFVRAEERRPESQHAAAPALRIHLLDQDGLRFCREPVTLGKYDYELSNRR